MYTQEQLINLLSDETTESQDFQNIFHRSEGEELTRHRLEYLWKTTFPPIMPVPVILNPGNPSFCWITDSNGKQLVKEVFEEGYIVPFLPQLQQLLSVKQIYDSVLESFRKNTLSFDQDNSQTYSDVWDGKFIKVNEVFIKSKGCVLCIQIYMDEVELANPLGSKKGKHKISVFYWVLLNLPPIFRSSLKSIMLLGIVNSSLLKERGVQNFLKPFLDDMELLENGLEFTVRNEKRIWHSVLLNFAGDIPAANFIGGFKEGVGFANLPCRNCFIDRRVNFESIHLENLCKMRDKTSHASQVDEIENAPTMAARDVLSSNYGVNGGCSLASLSYFDPTKCFMHDLMHVAYEGVLNDSCCLILRHLILDQNIKLDLETVNCDIANLKSDREFTVPPPIRFIEVTELKKLSFSSSELMCLAMCLPLVLSKFVNCENNHNYANFILLLEILSSLQCYSFTELELSKLERNIALHNSIFLQLYKAEGKSITPKLHSLLHFPNQIRLFGSPRYCWCFRYESKNAPFKKIMRRNCNFHNVPWSMATHNQKLVGLDVKIDGEGNYFDVQNRILGNFTSSVAVKVTRWENILCDKTKLFKNSLIKTAKKIRISGRICGIGTFFLLKLPQFESQPMFFRIADIIISNEGIFLIMEGVCNTLFERETFSYTCQPNKLFSVIQSHMLPFPAPLHSFLINDIFYVIPNYYHIL